MACIYPVPLRPLTENQPPELLSVYPDPNNPETATLDFTEAPSYSLWLTVSDPEGDEITIDWMLSRSVPPGTAEVGPASGGAVQSTLTLYRTDVQAGDVLIVEYRDSVSLVVTRLQWPVEVGP